MKKIALIAALAWSFSAGAISVEILTEALSNPEVKTQLQTVDIQKVQEIAAAKCPACFQVSVQGTKTGVLGLPVDYEMIFSTQYDLFSQKLNVTIDSETKN